MEDVLSLPHGGNIYHYSQRFGIPPDKFLDFSASVNPLGPSKAAMRALKEALPSLVNYPDPDCGGLKDALSAHLGVRRESLLIGNGSTELIYLLPRVFAPKKTLVFAPGFSDYERAARLAGSQVSFLTLKEQNGFMPEMDGLKKALSGVDMFFVCNPNNPTGTLLDKVRMLDVLKMARASGVFTAVDEAFIEYASENSILGDTVKSKDVAVLRNFTKFYGMPGLRAGYISAHPSVVSKLEAGKEPWSVNTLAERAAAAAIKDEPHAEKSLRLIKREKEYLHAELGGIPGLNPYPPSVNFILVKLSKKGLDAGSLTESLASKGILVRDCSNFRGLGDKFIRVAVKSRKENIALINALKSLYNPHPL
jgi:threonine-phosphate decarboxylase